MMLLPAWIAWGPKAAVRVLPAPIVEGRPAMLSALDTPQPVGIEPARPTPDARAVPWRQILLSVYLLGAVCLLLRLVIGTIRANRLTSADCIAPITVGLFRPRVILPEGWPEWPAARLGPILAHEQAHLRRHDPLVQWLALLNRAVFWFHPLAWWLESKLAGLAEEACDAAVLEQGHDAGEYAQCLIEMERSVMRAGTRFAVLGMAMPGSGLPGRVKKILDGARPARMSRLRLVGTSAACIAAMVVFGAATIERVRAQTTAPAAKPKFEAASIRPASPLGRDVPGQPSPLPSNIGRFAGGPGTSDPQLVSARLITLHTALLQAYGIKLYQLIASAPLDSQWDIEAKVPAGATAEQLNQMLQDLLEDRFHLKVHHEIRDLAAFNLVVAKGGLKLKDSVDARIQSTQTGIARSVNSKCVPPADFKAFAGLAAPPLPCGRPVFSGDRIMAQASNMAALVNILPALLDQKPVIDKTGLTDTYDFRTEFAQAMFGAQDDSSRPSIFTALEQDLGLKLESTKAPIDVLVVDHVDSAPTEN